MAADYRLGKSIREKALGGALEEAGHMSDYAKMVREIEALKDTKGELEGLTPVEATVKSKADTIYSLRFTREEMNRVRAAAAKMGIKVSELIRQGALQAAAAAQEQPSGRDTAIRKARELVIAAARALEKI
jgi:hypothetical protein